jgi:hypothetical protein
MRAAACFLAGALLVSAAGDREVPDVDTCRSMILTAPRDGWRLTVEVDGSARINYAALPQTARTGAGTFLFQKLHSQLAATVRPELKSDCVGTVEFVRRAGRSEGAAWCLTDEDLAVDQFEWAWAHLGPAESAVESEHLQTLRQMWDRRRRPRRNRQKGSLERDAPPDGS